MGTVAGRFLPSAGKRARAAEKLSVATEETTGSSSWADLNSELLVSIAAADGLSLRDYTCLRGVCAGWRCALVPPYPSLLSLDDSSGRASVFSLPVQRTFHLHQNLYTDVNGRRALAMQRSPHLHRDPDTLVESRGSVVGSCSNGRFVVAVDINYRPWCTEGIVVVDPRAREEVKIMPPPLNRGDHYDCVRKVVFAPEPDDDGTVVAMCDGKRVAYIDTRRSGMAWKIVDVITRDEYREHYHLADMAFAPGGDGKVYCLDTSGGVRMLRIPRGSQEEPSLTVLSVSHCAAFPRPYTRMSDLMSTKRLFLCHGSLYQVWKNHSITVRSGSRFSMVPDEIFVLRHDPGRQSPCWDAVKDLGGCSVFIGKNNSPVVVRPGAVPGVRGDCVYWIDWRCNPMVCDIATGTSKPCVLPYDACKGNCWYFGDDNMKSNMYLNFVKHIYLNFF